MTAGRLRRLHLGSALLVTAGAAAGVAALVLGRSAPRPAEGVVVQGHAGPVQTATATLRRELGAQDMSFTHVDCIENGRSYRGHKIIRCNVDFGDPHIEAYCAILTDGRMVTNHQDSGIPCTPDWAGFRIITYPAYLPGSSSKSAAATTGARPGG